MNGLTPGNQHFRGETLGMRSLAIAAMLGLLAGARASAAEPAATMFLCDPVHSGVHAADALGVKLAPRWRFRTNQLNRSTPVVLDGVVYVGSNNGRFYALDAASGKPRWAFAAAGPVNSSATVRAGVVYFADDHAVYALDARTGAKRWRARFGPDVAHPGHDWDFFQSSPTVAGRRLYVGSGDGNLYAFDAATGAPAWTFATKGRVRSTPAVAGGTVYVGSFDGNLYAINAESGTLRWRFKTKGNPDFPIGEVQSSPSVDGTTVFFGSRDGFLYAVDSRSGKKRWSVDEHESWVISSPAFANGTVFYGSSDGNAMRAIDERTGKRRWSFDAQGRVWSSPLLLDGRVYFGTGGGEVDWLDARKGTMLGFADSEGTIYSSIGEGDSTIFYASDDGYVYAVK